MWPGRWNRRVDWRNCGVRDDVFNCKRCFWIKYYDWIINIISINRKTVDFNKLAFITLTTLKSSNSCWGRHCRHCEFSRSDHNNPKLTWEYRRSYSIKNGIHLNARQVNDSQLSLGFADSRHHWWMVQTRLWVDNLFSAKNHKVSLRWSREQARVERQGQIKCVRGQCFHVTPITRWHLASSNVYDHALSRADASSLDVLLFVVSLWRNDTKNLKAFANIRRDGEEKKTQITKRDRLLHWAPLECQWLYRHANQNW